MIHTLRQLVRETLLAERRMQPVGGEHLVKRLNSEIKKLLSEPDIKNEMKAKLRGSTGLRDDDKLEKFVSDDISNASYIAQLHRSSGYVVIEFYISQFLNSGPIRTMTEKRADDIIRKTSKNYGWSVLSANHRAPPARKLRYNLEKNYGNRISETGEVLYHVTRSHDVKKILRQGLIPHQASHETEEDKQNDIDSGEQLQQGRQYSPRVYVTPSLELADELSFSFQDDGPDANASDYEDYTFLRIDTSKLLPGTKFYEDSEFATSRYKGQSFWTYSRIPAAALSVDIESLAGYKKYLREAEAAANEDPWY
jgi:hypothetical protein